MIAMADEDHAQARARQAETIALEFKLKAAPQSAGVRSDGAVADQGGSNPLHRRHDGVRGQKETAR
jgi:hypothetical protein